MLFSVGYTLPYDQSGIMIYSLSQVQNFLGDDFKPPKQKGAHPPSGNPLMYLLVGDDFKPPKQKGAHPPSGNPLMYLLVGEAAPKKRSLFLTTFLKQKQVLGA
jgi:hypothetical protein